jgi:hypothetical protein
MSSRTRRRRDPGPMHPAKSIAPVGHYGSRRSPGSRPGSAGMTTECLAACRGETGANCAKAIRDSPSPQGPTRQGNRLWQHAPGSAVLAMSVPRAPPPPLWGRSVRAANREGALHRARSDVARYFKPQGAVVSACGESPSGSLRSPPHPEELVFALAKTSVSKDGRKLTALLATPAVALRAMAGSPA